MYGTSLKVRTVQTFLKVRTVQPLYNLFKVSGVLAMFVFHCPTFIRVISRRETQLLKR